MPNQLNYSDIEENQKLQEEFYMKIYMTNKDKITGIDKAMNIFQIVAILSGLVFLISFTIQVSLKQKLEYGWSFTFLPLIITSIALALAVNLFLSLTVIFSDEVNLASWVGFFSANITAVCFVCFIVLLGIKLDGLIPSLAWKMTLIPIYLILGTLLFYFIFMMPAFIHNKTYWEIILISFLILTALMATVLLNGRLDNSYVFSFSAIFMPLWVMCGIFLVYCIWEAFVDQNPLKISIHFLSLVFLVGAVVTTPLILDGVYKIPAMVPPILLMLAYIPFFANRFLLKIMNYSLFEENEQAKGNKEVY